MTTIETCKVCRCEFVSASPPEWCCSARCWREAVAFTLEHGGFRELHFANLPREGRPPKHRRDLRPLTGRSPDYPLPLVG